MQYQQNQKKIPQNSAGFMLEYNLSHLKYRKFNDIELNAWH